MLQRYIKRSSLLILLSVFLVGSLYGQQRFEKRIKLRYPSSGSSITQTTDGGFIVGCTEYDSPGTDAVITASIIKLDSTGTILWTRNFDYGPCGLTLVKATSDGGCLVKLWFETDISNSIWTAIIKLNSIGNLIWKNDFLEMQMPYGISLNDDGSCIISGVSGMFKNSLNGFIFISPNGQIDSITSIQLPGKNSYINALWRSDAGFFLAGYIISNKYEGQSLIHCSKKGEILSGQFLDKDISIYDGSMLNNGGYAYCGNVTKAAGHGNDIVIGGYDKNGNQLWRNSFDIFGKDQTANSITQSSNGIITAVGRSDANGVIIQVGEDGFLHRVKRFESDGMTSSFDQLITTEDGGFAIVGAVSINDKDSSEVLVMLLDSTLEGCHLNNIICSKQELAVAATSLDLFTATDSVPWFHSTKDIPRIEAPFIEGNLCELGIVESSAESTAMVVPNPLFSGNVIKISCDGDSDNEFVVVVTNLQGVVVLHKILERDGDGAIQLSLASTLPGMYYIDLVGKNSNLHRRVKVVKR